MAILSTHTLNSVDGTHAGGITLSLLMIDGQGVSTKLLDGKTDEGGRFSGEIPSQKIDVHADYQLVLNTAEYFATRDLPDSGRTVLDQVVVRFKMPDADSRYHIPFMLAPHAYSVWVAG